MHLRNLSRWYIYLTPALACVSIVDDLSVGGLNYTGFLWIGMYVLGASLLAVWGLWTFDHRSLLLWAPWLLWFGYVWLSLCWAPSIGRRSIQEAMQLSMPLVVGMLAHAAIRTEDDLRSLFKFFCLTASLLMIVAVAEGLQIFERLGIASRARPVALSGTLLGGLFFAMVPERKFLAVGGWLWCLAITVFTGSRMATAALLLLPLLHLRYSRVIWNVLGLIVVGLAGIGLFYTPIFQERFFQNESGTISDVASGEFDGSGRFESWPQILEKATERPWLGSGPSSSSEYVPLVWEGSSHPHNDYLRIGFEFGLVGLSLYGFAVVVTLAVLLQRVRMHTGWLAAGYAGVWLGVWALLITGITDNTITYNVFFTNPLFVLLGASYGVSTEEMWSMPANYSGVPLRLPNSTVNA